MINPSAIFLHEFSIKPTMTIKEINVSQASGLHGVSKTSWADSLVSRLSGELYKFRQSRAAYTSALFGDFKVSWAQRR